jgi:PAS domain S-box-containing protein
LEPKPKITSRSEELSTRTVQFFIDGQLVALKGAWSWDLPADELFCSDVMPSIQHSAVAITKCLIHPDDLQCVQHTLLGQIPESIHLQFRVISTWGKVHTIEGNGVFNIEKEEHFGATLQQNALDRFSQEQEVREQEAKIALQVAAHHYAEQISGHGIWYVNSVTNEVYYSDNVYRIFGLPPQSLNAHLHTFTSFVHPDEKQIFIDMFDQAYRSQLPLHIQYRVLLKDEQEKYISLTTKWIYNQKGELIMLGVSEDITERKTEERERELLKDDLNTTEQLLRNDELLARTANWHINLYTRKIEYSQNIHRIFGTKGMHFTNTVLLNYVHPDDYELVSEAHKRIYKEHIVPDIEYRIIRPDGRVRYLKQKGKMTINTQREMVMVGTTQDITDSVLSAQKIANLETQKEIHRLATAESEEKSGAGVWIWDLQSGEMEWSEGIFNLLGYKANNIQPSQKILYNYIHPEDRKQFISIVTLVSNGLPSEELACRIISKNETKYIKAYFRLLALEDKQIFTAILIDKTAEWHLQQTLDKQARLAEMLSDASLDMVFVTDANNYLIRWNRRCEEAFNLKKEKVVGHNLFDVFPRLKTPDLMDLMLRVLRGETIHISEAQGFIGPGIYDVSLNPIKDEGGEIIAVLHIIRNITTEYELKHQQKERLGFIERLLEASIDRVIVLDKNMNYLFWNRKAEEYYNLKKDAVLGRNILEVSPGLVNTLTYTEFRRALRGETVHIPAVQNLEARIGYFETYLIPVKDDRQEVASILWITHDLSKEFQLQQQEKRADAILNTINEAFVELNSEGIFRYINQRAERLWKIDRDELIGKSLWESFLQSADVEGYNMILQALNDKVPVQREYFSTGSNRWIYMSVTPTSDGAIILFYDIEELKKNQQLLEAIFNASVYGIVLFKTLRNEGGEVVDFEVGLQNEVFRHWLGKEVVSKRFTEQFGAFWQGNLLERFKQVLDTGQAMDMEIKAGGPETERWFRIIAVKFGEDILSTAEDISERKKIEERFISVNDQLQESQLQNQQIVDATPDIITIYDLVKGDAIYMNRTIGDVLGYSIGELKEMGHKGRAARIIHPDDLPLLIAFNEGMKGATDEEVRTLEYRVR